MNYLGSLHPSDTVTIVWQQRMARTAEHGGLLLSAQIVRLGGKVPDGQLVEAVAIPWDALLREFERDPELLHKFHWRKMEELVAAAYEAHGFDEVILTPRSGDGGRDVIATRRGLFSIRILEQVKKYAPGNTVPANDVRSLVGVLYADQRASKGIITTTSEFAPEVESDPGIACFLPTRLELRNGTQLREMLMALGRRR